MDFKIFLGIIIFCGLQNECSAVDFQCPDDDIAATQCMGPKDCLYPHPVTCSKFIHCEVNADGRTARPTVKDCAPGGLEWNDEKKECDWPQGTCIPGRLAKSPKHPKAQPGGKKQKNT